MRSRQASAMNRFVKRLHVANSAVLSVPTPRLHPIVQLPQQQQHQGHQGQLGDEQLNGEPEMARRVPVPASATASAIAHAQAVGGQPPATVARRPAADDLERGFVYF
jgi:hypothetical protein